MTGPHRKRAISAINLAKIAFAGTIIGGGGLGLAAHAVAANDGRWDAPQTWAQHLPLAPVPDDPPVLPAPPTGPPPPPPPGPPPVPAVPSNDQTQSPGQLGYLREIWHEFHQNPNDAIAGLTGAGADSTDPAASPPPGLPVAPQGPPPPPGFTPLPQPAAPLTSGPLSSGQLSSAPLTSGPLSSPQQASGPPPSGPPPGPQDLPPS
jgi:hypothetical protein